MTEQDEGFITGAFTGGRRLTLDALPVDTESGEPMPIILPRRRVESSLTTGLRIEWITGRSDDDDGAEIEFDLTAGAGVGSPYLVLTVRLEDGDVREEVVHMGSLVRDWVKVVIDEGPTPKPQEADDDWGVNRAEEHGDYR